MGRKTFNAFLELARSVGEELAARSLRCSADAWLAYGVEGDFGRPCTAPHLA